jgi:thiol:disulfide interchange protein DsbD
VLGTFPSLLKSVPRRGVWMEDIKQLLGVILIGVAVYYLALLIPSIVYWPLVVLLCLIAAGIIAVKSAERHAQRRLLSAWRAVGVVFVLAATYFAATRVPAAIADYREAQVAAGEDMRIAAVGPAVQETTGTAVEGTTTGTLDAGEGGLVWLKNEAEAVALVKETGRPMMVDFTATWCTACKQLDKFTFSEESVRKELAGFVLLKIDCTEETFDNMALQKKYGSKSLPTVAFVNKDGELLSDLTLYTFEKPEEFLKRLAKVPR